MLAGCRGVPGSQVVLAGSLVLRRGAVGPKIAGRALAGADNPHKEPLSATLPDGNCLAVQSRLFNESAG